MTLKKTTHKLPFVTYALFAFFLVITVAYLIVYYTSIKSNVDNLNASQANISSVYFITSAVVYLLYFVILFTIYIKWWKRKRDIEALIAYGDIQKDQKKEEIGTLTPTFLSIIFYALMLIASMILSWTIYMTLKTDLEVQQSIFDVSGLFFAYFPIAAAIFFGFLGIIQTPLIADLLLILSIF